MQREGDYILKKILSILSIIILLIVSNSSSLVEAAKPNPNPIKIVIDPGHGGHDSGAVGINGIYEKDVNLDISLRLKQLLLAAGYQVVLTRETDHTLIPYTTTTEKREDLQARVDVATHVQADLFVSIHANYYKSDSKGTMVLYYDPMNDSAIYTATDKIKKWSQDSKQLATNVLKSIVSSMGLKDLGIIPSNVYVVRSGSVPSILVETAFLSNREEAAKLADSTFRQQMAESIARGILNYIPPRYIDIRNHWAKTEISTLSYQGIINGYKDGLFKPEQEMTRVEWIALLDRALGLDEETSTETSIQFSDIPQDYWAYGPIMHAVQKGIVNGYNDGTFRPNQMISREEMVEILYRALYPSNSEETVQDPNEPTQNDSDIPIQEEQTTESDTQNTVNTGVKTDEAADTVSISSTESPFIDIPSDHWSTIAISTLYTNGLIKGVKENEFGLGKTVTRAEAATLIYRMVIELTHE